MDGENDEPTGEKCLNVTLTVNEAGVTGTEIPITVVSVKKSAEDVSSNVKYTYYVEGKKVEEATTEKNHTFSGLDEKKSYTLKVRAVNDDDDWGEAEVRVLSFSVYGEDYDGEFCQYFRCTNGMNWENWKNSSYDKNASFTGRDFKAGIYDDYGSPTGWVEYHESGLAYEGWGLSDTYGSIIKDEQGYELWHNIV